VTPTELAPLLRECYTDRLALLESHVASARSVGDYDVNNAYQYIIAREEVHLYWLHRAVVDAGAAVPAGAGEPSVPKASVRELAGMDGRANEAFVTKWGPKVAGITHARHRKMLEVVLGEVKEHQRLFEQAAEGRVDVIGVPLAGTVRRGSVLDTRWVE
jgi:hypothetical protein